MSRIFGPIRQNGYVVRDIEAALKHWTTVLGIGPFFYVERARITDLQYKGQPSAAEVHVALAAGPATPRTTRLRRQLTTHSRLSRAVFLRRILYTSHPVTHQQWRIKRELLRCNPVCA
jgi:hypothetical protein